MVKGLTWLLHKVRQSYSTRCNTVKVGHGYSTRLDMVKGSTWSKGGHGYSTRLDRATKGWT